MTRSHKRKNKATREMIAADRAILDQWCSSHGRTVDVQSPFHWRIRDVNYYPTSGTIYVDGHEESEREKGLKALIDLLTRRPS